MEARRLSLLFAALALAAPVRAAAGGALTQARAVSSESANFDGVRARPEADPVRAGSMTDRRTPGQIAKDEQVLADARAAQAAARSRSAGNLANGEDVEGKKKVKTEWMSIPLAQTLFVGGLTGLLIGALFGGIGLAVGALLGAALYYGLSVHAANKAKAAGDE